MPEITSLVPLRSAKDRMRVFIDQEHALTISKKSVDKLKLSVGSETDRDAILRQVEEDEKKAALNAALHYLGRAEHSRAEVARYLEVREYPAAVIEEVVEKMAYYGYVDDARYAGALVRDCAAVRGKSRRALKYDMQKKGLSPDTIEKAMGQYTDREERENAARIARRYLGREDAPKPELERKAAAALARRGYDWELIRDVMRALGRGEDGEEA